VERRGGCGTIGEETVRHPPQPIFLNTGPGLAGTQTRKGVYIMFKRGAIGNCHAREARSLEC
jgi:hypothetical protein